MGNKRDREKEERLARQQAEDRARQQALITKADAPKPVETELEREQLGWLKDTKAPDFDVTKLSALTPQLSLYRHAKAGQEGQRMGIGALRMGMEGQNPGLSALLASQQQARREQDAAGQLEGAFAMKDAQMRGDIMPLLGLQQNRSMGLAGLASNNANQSTNMWANFRPAPSFWQQLLMAGVSGGSQAASAYLGRG